MDVRAEFATDFHQLCKPQTLNTQSQNSPPLAFYSDWRSADARVVDQRKAPFSYILQVGDIAL